MTVREMLARMDARELAEWMAYDRIEPFGDERADLRMGILAALMASAWGDGKKKPKPSDFMPFLEKQRETDPAAQQAIANRIARVSQAIERQRKGRKPDGPDR